MRHLKNILLLLLIGLLFSCGGSSSYNDSYDEDESYDQEDGYQDDAYCADVEYYNPNTGTRSTYQLNVDVEDNKLVKIHWPNGGWLDDDHFYPEELDGDECSIISDKGNHYDVEITGPACSWTDEARFLSDVEEEEESFTCPKCGKEKGEYAAQCPSCVFESTCNTCGGEKNNLDENCHNCRIEEENRVNHTCSSCGGYEAYVMMGECSSCQNEEDE